MSEFRDKINCLVGCYIEARSNFEIRLLLNDKTQLDKFITSKNLMYDTIREYFLTKYGDEFLDEFLKLVLDISNCYTEYKIQAGIYKKNHDKEIDDLSKSLVKLSHFLQEFPE